MIPTISTRFVAVQFWPFPNTVGLMTTTPNGRTRTVVSNTTTHLCPGHLIF
jgi:hypothetical protein